MFFAFTSFSQTTIPAGNVNGIWTAANSPYQVQGLIVVQDGQSLIIEPGVTVEFDATARLRVKGNIIASGTSTDQILMTASDVALGWQSIFFDSVNVISDSSIFEFCTIEYGKGTGLFRIINFNKLRIENCILQNGDAISGGCAVVANSDALFKNNLITNNFSQTSGGAFNMSGGTPYFSGNTITNNIASDFGGAFRIPATTSAVFVNNNISFNQSQSGGAFNMLSFSDITFDGNYFEGNSSIFDGGVFWGINIFPTITNNTFIGNTAGEDGGVGFFQSDTYAQFSGNYFSGNSARRGGVFQTITRSELYFDNDIFHENTAIQSLPLFDMTSDCVLSMKSCNITNNSGSVGFALSGGATGEFVNCIFANNGDNSSTLAVISGSATSASFKNTHFVNNQASGAASLVIITSGASSDFANCIFHGNISVVPATNVSIEFNNWNPSSATFTNCNIEGGLASIDIDGGPNPTYVNNIDADPQFIAPSAGAGNAFNGLNANWNIGSNSPCYNAGTADTIGLSLPATDLGGNARIIQDTVDIGAYELMEDLQVLAQTSDTSVCFGDSITLTVATSGIPTIAYQWQFNGVDISGADADSTQVQGQILNGGNYACIVSNSFGADTSDVISVTVNIPPAVSSLGVDTAYCANESLTLFADTGAYDYSWNNVVSTADSLIVNSIGAYFYTVVDTNGCSALSDTITVSEFALPNVALIADTACVGDSIVLSSNQTFVSYNWNNGASLSDSIVAFTQGQYILEVADTNNCIASDTTNLIFNALPLLDLGADPTICPGDSALLFAPANMIAYYWNNGISSTDSIYANSMGDWFVSITDTNGCVNSDTVNVTNLPTSIGTDVISACESYTWIDGNTYFSSNNSATFVVTNSVGCDSTVTLNLTINNATTGTEVITACDSYLWIDGITYTNSNNSAQFTVTNALGCDSVVTLNLTIINSTTASDSVSGCDVYTWIDGNNYFSSNNTSQWTIPNAAGCDSIITLNLTMNSSTSGTDTVLGCNNFTWIDGITYTASNNTAQWTLPNVAGCDSLVTLDLTINYVDIGVFDMSPEFLASSISGTFQWLDCLNNYAPIAGETSAYFVATQIGEYALEVQENGCVDTTYCFMVNDVGLVDLEPKKWSVFPNPTQNTITIQFNESFSGSVEVTDPSGRLIRKKSIEGILESELKLGNDPGVYFVRVISGGREEVVSVVKM